MAQPDVQQWGEEEDQEEDEASKQPADLIVEVFNYEALIEKLDGQQVAKPALALAYTHGASRTDGDAASRPVQYYRKHGIPGRRYAKWPASQWMKTADKKIAFCTEPHALGAAGSKCVDVDIDNCFVTLLFNILGYTCDVATLFPTLTALKEHHRAARSFLAEYLGITVKNAKRELIRIIHLGKPKHDLPFLWNLAAEMNRAVATLLEMPQFAYLDDKFNNRRNPLATKMHYALAAIEDDILSELQAFVARESGMNIMVLMFDGATTRVEDASLVERLRQRLRFIEDKWHVSFSLTVW